MTEDPSTDPTVPDRPEDEEEEEDWFGEGSGFESGEDLAAALFSMANVAVPRGLPSDAHGPGVQATTFEEFAPGGDQGRGLLAAYPQTEWMPIPTDEQRRPGQDVPVTPRPSWTVRQAKEVMSGGGATGRQWSIRHGVHMLQLTEDVMDRLRRDAIEITWAAAGLAVSQQSERKRTRRIKRDSEVEQG